MFAGDSLEIQTGGELRIKTAAAITVTNLMLTNAANLVLTSPSGGTAATLAGNLTLNGAAVFKSGLNGGETTNTLTISSPIGGGGGFTTPARLERLFYPPAIILPAGRR